MKEVRELSDGYPPVTIAAETMQRQQLFQRQTCVSDRGKDHVSFVGLATANPLHEGDLTRRLTSRSQDAYVARIWILEARSGPVFGVAIERGGA